MARNQLTGLAGEIISVDSGRNPGKTAARVSLLAVVIWWGAPGVVRAGEVEAGAARFVGSTGCSASSCHGGGGTFQSEFTQWSKNDFHHERPFATLTTARASRIADNLKIADATRDARCTACHAPLQTVPPALLSPENKLTEGVSCENCHAPAENWLRSHTRTDWSTADRVRAGMRDLKNLYVRANTCVACHQCVDATVRGAGHPELVFELDGQLASEPRHWSRAKDKPGPQIWLVGQAVALREISWQLAGEKEPERGLRDQWEGLLHLMVPLAAIESKTLDARALIAGSSVNDFKTAQQWSDDFAKVAESLDWTDDLSRRYLNALAGADEVFSGSGLSNPAQARYGERLVLALDRLLTSQASLASDPKATKALEQLYADVQDLPGFAPVRFARDLNGFRASLPVGSP